MTMIQEIEARLTALEQEEASLSGDETVNALRRRQIARERGELLETCRTLTPADKVWLARHNARPGVADYIHALFTDFFEQKGDRLCAEDPSILGGVARFHDRPVTVIGHRKGRTLEENLKYNKLS